MDPGSHHMGDTKLKSPLPRAGPSLPRGQWSAEWAWGTRQDTHAGYWSLLPVVSMAYESLKLVSRDMSERPAFDSSMHIAE